MRWSASSDMELDAPRPDASLTAPSLASMPALLKAVMVAFGLHLALLAWMIARGPTTNPMWISLVLTCAAIFGLLRGSETARALVRGASVLGILGSVVTLIRLVPVLRMMPELGYLGLAMAGFGLAIAVLTFVTLGRDDVATWLARRSFGS